MIYAILVGRVVCVGLKELDRILVDDTKKQLALYQHCYMQGIERIKELEDEIEELKCSLRNQSTLLFVLKMLKVKCESIIGKI